MKVLYPYAILLCYSSPPNLLAINQPPINIMIPIANNGIENWLQSVFIRIAIGDARIRPMNLPVICVNFGFFKDKFNQFGNQKFPMTIPMPKGAKIPNTRRTSFRLKAIRASIKSLIVSMTVSIVTEQHQHHRTAYLRNNHCSCCNDPYCKQFQISRDTKLTSAAAPPFSPRTAIRITIPKKMKNGISLPVETE